MVQSIGELLAGEVAKTFACSRRDLDPLQQAGKGDEVRQMDFVEQVFPAIGMHRRRRPRDHGLDLGERRRHNRQPHCEGVSAAQIHAGIRYHTLICSRTFTRAARSRVSSSEPGDMGCTAIPATRSGMDVRVASAT